MFKKVFVIALAFISFSCFAINLNCMKMHGINRGGLASQHGIFRDCFSRHFYEIKISNVKPVDTNQTYTIKILPMLKLCKREVVFPYYDGIVEKEGIKLDCKKGYTCVYVSPLTKWTNDTWPDVIGDWSKGLVNNTIFVELISENDGKIVRYWTNVAMSSIRNSKSIEDSKMKVKLNSKYSKWLEEIVIPNLHDSQYFEEGPRFEDMTWKEFKRR